MSAHHVPNQADGLSNAESASMAFLARAGMVPSTAAYRAGDDRALPAAAAAPVKSDELSASEIETTALLTRAGFVRGADTAYVPGEADGLTAAESDGMAFLARAGFVPSAKVSQSIMDSRPPEGFNR